MHDFDLGLRAQLLGQQIRTISLHRDEGCERCCERRRQLRNAAPAAAAIRQRDDIAWTRPDLLHQRRHHRGRHRGDLRQPHRSLRLDRRDGRADLAPHLIGGLDRADHRMQLAEPAFPLLDDELELGVHAHHHLDLRALFAVKRPEDVFGGHRDMVFVVTHQANPRHSRISSMLRRSQVFTVLTGVLNFSANCSRLHPL